MYAMIHIAESWATKSENRFAVFLLLFAMIGGLVVMGTSAYNAWKADLPSKGGDPRRRRW
jgi:hypothetical protein